MPRYYSVAFENTSSTVQSQFFELTPASNKPITLLGCVITQNSDAQDANEKLLRVGIWRGTTSTGAGGTSVTPKLLGTTGAAAGFTANVMSSAVGSTSSAEIVHAETFNARAGWFYYPPPELRFDCSTGQYRFVIRLEAAPADQVNFAGTAYVAEI